MLQRLTHLVLYVAIEKKNLITYQKSFQNCWWRHPFMSNWETIFYTSNECWMWGYLSKGRFCCHPVFNHQLTAGEQTAIKSTTIRLLWVRIIITIKRKLAKSHGAQPAFKCWKLTIGTLEQGVKYVQSYQ